MAGRPRLAIGTYGTVRAVRVSPGRYSAFARFRDLDGRVREVGATDSSRNRAIAELKLRLAHRPGYGRGGLLGLSSPFGDLCDLWLADLAARDISEGTKQNYEDNLRVHIRPFFDGYTLGEISTGRVEAFLQRERAISYSRAKHSRTVLSLVFGFALRNDALGRNPLEGTSRLKRPKGAPRALSLEQVQAIRRAAALWRTEPGVSGPKPDDNVRDALEVLLGTSMRPGEVLALRPCDVVDGRRGMTVTVRGTIVYRKGRGTLRQEWPKTDASVRTIPVPAFAASVIRRRVTALDPSQREVTIFHNRTFGPLSLQLSPR